MARKASASAPAPVMPVVRHALFACPLFPGRRIGEPTCVEKSSVYQTNLGTCTARSCASLWRRCLACTLQGYRGADAVVVDAVQGLCQFHRENGREARREEEALVGAMLNPHFLGEVGDSDDGRGSAPTPELSGSRPHRRTLVEPQETMRRSASPEVRHTAAAPQPLRDVAAPVAQPPKPTAEGTEGGISVSVDRILPWSGQPRRYFDPEKQRRLEASVKAVGVLETLVVWPIPGRPGYYQLMSGERRLRAAKSAGQTHVRVVTTLVANEEERFLQAAIANHNRDECTPLDTAYALQRIKDRMGLTLAQLGECFGYSDRWAEQHLVLLRLPAEVQEMIEPVGELVYSVAAQLAYVPSPELQVSLARRIVELRLTTTEASHFIRTEVRQAGVKGAAARAREPYQDFRNLQRYLERTSEGMARILENPDRGLPTIFLRRGPADLDWAIARLGEILEGLGKLAGALTAFREERKRT
ncbi:ParB/RepB/Spo0J family partition protein [Candidatus Parcubacteria bacterium]|nr:ParB/RepB/Spo0J family partition protein [Candidatus Parcubacteria bacterium]